MSKSRGRRTHSRRRRRRLTTGEEAKRLARDAMSHWLDVTLDVVEQQVVEAADAGYYHTSVAFTEDWYSDATNQRKVLKCLWNQDLDACLAPSRGSHDTATTFIISWGDVMAEPALVLHASSPAPKTFVRPAIAVVEADTVVGRATLDALLRFSAAWTIIVTASTADSCRQLCRDYPGVEAHVLDLDEASAGPKAKEALASASRVLFVPSQPMLCQPAHLPRVLANLPPQCHVVLVSMQVPRDTTTTGLELCAQFAKMEKLVAATPRTTHTVVRTSWILDTALAAVAHGVRSHGFLALPLPADDPTPVWAPVSASDVGWFITRVLTKSTPSDIKPTTITVTGPQAVSGYDMADAVADTMGQRVSFLPLSSEAYMDMLLAVDYSPLQAAAIVQYFNAVAEGKFAWVSKESFSLYMRTDPLPMKEYVKANTDLFLQEEPQRRAGAKGKKKHKKKKKKKKKHKEHKKDKKGAKDEKPKSKKAKKEDKKEDKKDKKDSKKKHKKDSKKEHKKHKKVVEDQAKADTGEPEEEEHVSPKVRGVGKDGHSNVSSPAFRRLAPNAGADSAGDSGMSMSSLLSDSDTDDSGIQEEEVEGDNDEHAEVGDSLQMSCVAPLQDALRRLNGLDDGSEGLGSEGSPSTDSTDGSQGGAAAPPVAAVAPASNASQVHVFARKRNERRKALEELRGRRNSLSSASQQMLALLDDDDDEEVDDVDDSVEEEVDDVVADPIAAPAAPTRRSRGMSAAQRVSVLLDAESSSLSSFDESEETMSAEEEEEEAEGEIRDSPLPGIDVPDQPFYEWVFEHAHRHGSKAAFIDQTGRTLTFRQFVAATRKIAAGLAHCGLVKGDVFCLMSPNVPEYVMAWHAVNMAGGIVTTVSPLASEDEIVAQLSDCGAAYILSIRMFAEKAKAVAKRCRSVRQLFSFDRAQGCKTFMSLLSNTHTLSGIHVDPAKDVAAILYTSTADEGSRGVQLTHRNLVANVAQTCALHTDDLDASSVFLAVLPFHHLYTMVAVVSVAMVKGASVVVMPSFEPKKYLDLIAEHRVTHAHVVAPMVAFLTANAMVPSYDLSSLRWLIARGSDMSPTLEARVCERLGVHVRQCYGVLELGSCVSMTPPLSFGDHVPGSCGVLLPNMSAKIVSMKTRRLLPPGETHAGELWLAGPNQMLGYLGEQDDDADDGVDRTVDAEGFQRSGDIAFFTKDGHLFVVNRLAELIRVDEHLVAPAPLEALLLAHPAIVDVAVVAKPNVSHGHVPIAYVKLTKAGAANLPTAEEVQQWVSQRRPNAPHEHLSGGVEFVDEIPRNQAGAILRSILRAKHPPIEVRSKIV